MSLLNYIDEKNAEGIVKQVYNGFSAVVKKVPNVVQFHSASPELFPKFMNYVDHFSNHPTLDPILIAYTRLMVSTRKGGEYCKRLQSALLKMYGETEERIKVAVNDSANLEMDNKRKAILLFAVNMVDNKIENAKPHVKNLKNHGWSDKDIYELCAIAGLQSGMVPLIKGFEVEFDF